MQLLFTENDIQELDAIVANMPTHWGLQIIRLTNKIAERQEQINTEKPNSNENKKPAKK
jgi:hypothetical protein